MRSYLLSGNGRTVFRFFQSCVRRIPWICEGITTRKAWALGAAVYAFLSKRSYVSALPTILKIDISPVCNLRCPTCIHAEPGNNEKLLRQRFSPAKRMNLERFSSLLNEVSGHTSAVSLYYLGDPLAHPDIIPICRVARAAKVNVHVCTNLSFRLTDEKIEQLIKSGITHFSVCIDGMTQDTYARSRVGGDIELVLGNLTRLVLLKRRLNSRFPRVEVQYVEYRHNQHEIQWARRFARRLGVEQFVVIRGHTYNYTEFDPVSQDQYEPFSAGILPKCLWPYLYMLIRYDGEAIPCCNHRLGEQYAEGAVHYSLGNVFERGIAAVWNSNEYRSARELVSALNSPAILNDGPHFCAGCPKLFRMVGNTSRDSSSPRHPGPSRQTPYEELQPPAGLESTCDQSVP